MDDDNTSIYELSNSPDDNCCDFTDYWLYVVTYIIIAVGLPLTLVAIYAVFSLVQKDHVAPIYVINLLISDFIQLLCLIGQVSNAGMGFLDLIYSYSVMASVCFMVCIAGERYLVIAWPLWYRHRRTIKVSLVVCALTWIFSLVFILLTHFWIYLHYNVDIVFGILLLLPFPLLIFFLAGTIKALSAAISVRADEKRRIVGLLVLVLLIYTLLFLPSIIMFLVKYAHYLINVALFFVRLSPLADLFLYIFLRKGAVNQVLACLCCCRKDTSQQTSSMNDNTHTVSSI